MFRLMFLLLIVAFGIWAAIFYQPSSKKAPSFLESFTEYPIREHKSFVVVIYAHNQALWCERVLRSVFEQDYDHYRVIFVDDGSLDRTEEKAKQFILENNQEGKVIFIRNESFLGPVASLYRAIDGCLDREIVVPLNGKDWLSSPFVFKRLNQIYQHPEVWLGIAQGIEYPSYRFSDEMQSTFYAAIFKQIRLKDLFSSGQFALHPESYFSLLKELCSGHILQIKEPLFFFNQATCLKKEAPPSRISSYSPLASFPFPRKQSKASVLVFSSDRPLQLYACLESLQRYLTHFEQISVLYRGSSLPFLAGYEKVKQAFPLIHFISQTDQEFKPCLEKIVKTCSSDYLLFVPDDGIMKDFADLNVCVNQMDKTDAYGFYLHFGKHICRSYIFNCLQNPPPSHPLAAGIYAWNFRSGEGEWKCASSLGMTLFKKEKILPLLKSLKYKDPPTLEAAWKEKVPPDAVGLYFERSKLVNIPINQVGSIDHPHMNYLNTEELLAKFNQGLKIDIEPLYKIENGSTHLDYIPELILR